MQCLCRSLSTLLLAGVLPSCGLLAAAAKPAPHLSSSEHARAVHLLDRMTFGPRPGEVERVQAMGIDRWLDLQLHPGKIDDSALAQRLAAYQAPFMSPGALMFKFPPRTLIRQTIAGRIAVPPGSPQREIWESQMAIMQRKLERKRDGNAQSQVAVNASAQQPLNNMEQSSANDPSEAPDFSGGLDVDSLVSLGPKQRYQALLKLPPGAMPEVARSLPRGQRADLLEGFDPAQREAVLALLSPRLVVVNEAQSVRLLEDIYSQRELERVMTEFWLNHFNISANKSAIEPYYLSEFEHKVIAPRALGKFEDLLDAVAESPAMLLYLDNEQSVGPDSLFALRREYPRVASFQPVRAKRRQPSGINENYGRELMELHTVGVNGGYTQQDVIEAAKVLTGWTVAPPRQGGGFRFDENRHEPGTKIVMGHKIRGGGQGEGLQLLHLLATSPSTARFISRKLAVRFVSDDPPPALVNRMAKAFLSSKGNISAVLRVMIDSPEFWSAPDTGNKIKTPLDYVVSAARATDADVSQPFRLVSELRVMGMPLTGTQEPNGYSMTNDAWTSTSALVNRMNFALALASNRIPGVSVPLDSLLGQDASAMTPAQQEASLEQRLLHGNASPQIHQAVLASLSDTAVQDRAAARFVLAGDRGGSPFAAGMGRTRSEPDMMPAELMTGLLIGSPEFQRR